MSGRLKNYSTDVFWVEVPVSELREVAGDMNIVIRAFFNQQETEEAVGAAERLDVDLAPFLKGDN